MKNKHEEIDSVYEKLDLVPSDEPKFIKLYFDDISKLYSLSKNATTFFYETMKLVTYNPTDSLHNLIYFTSSRKKSLYKKLTNNPSTAYTLFMRAKKELVDAELLIEVGTEGDTYLVDSSICSKTSWANTEVMQSIQLTVTYESSGKTLSTLIEEHPSIIKKEVEQLRDIKSKSPELKNLLLKERSKHSLESKQNSLNK